MESSGNQHLATSDKITWHRYMDFYGPHLTRLGDASKVLEYGVLHGASIRYLADRFSEAQVIGADILPPQDDWPTSERIEYVQVDQGQPEDLRRLFEEQPGPYDLVIEDGSHDPVHQRNCLVATLPHVRDGGVYILEDLHTSHPAYRGPYPPIFGGRDKKTANSYHVLLAFEHLQAMGGGLTDAALAALTERSLYSQTEVRELFDQIASVDLYRRSTLPLSCFKCGTDEFDFVKLVCRCGAKLMDEADSMSAVITVKHHS